jgi:hypothetical protein
MTPNTCQTINNFRRAIRRAYPNIELIRDNHRLFIRLPGYSEMALTYAGTPGVMHLKVLPMVKGDLRNFTCPSIDRVIEYIQEIITLDSI